MDTLEKEQTKKVQLPAIEIEVPAKTWDWYMSIIQGLGATDTTPFIAKDISWLYSDFLKNLRTEEHLLGSQIHTISEELGK